MADVCQCCQDREKRVAEFLASESADDVIVSAAAHSVIRKRQDRPQDWREVLLAKLALILLHSCATGGAFTHMTIVPRPCFKCGREVWANPDERTPTCSGGCQ